MLLLILVAISILLVASLSATFSFLIWRGLQKNVVDSAKVVADLRHMADQMMNSTSELKHTTDLAAKKEETKLIFVNPYMRAKNK